MAKLLLIEFLCIGIRVETAPKCFHFVCRGPHEVARRDLLSYYEHSFVLLCTNSTRFCAGILVLLVGTLDHW